MNKVEKAIYDKEYWKIHLIQIRKRNKEYGKTHREEGKKRAIKYYKKHAKLTEDFQPSLALNV